MAGRFAHIARALVDVAAGTFAATAGRMLESGRVPPDDHRPWPVPSEPWVMAQTWEDLVFVHWPVRAEDLRPLLPGGLPLDTFDGSAWFAITPFRVQELRLRGLPAIPRVSTFREINVRTYVTLDGKPGVFFFSLDADTALGVQAARFWYLLPYFLASCALEVRDGGVRFESERDHSGAPSAAFAIDYRPLTPVERAQAGSLEWWLTERYCLYTVDGTGTILRAEIHHVPWPLQRAEAEIRRNTMASPLGLGLGDRPALLHYAAKLDVNAWRLHPVRRDGRPRS